MGGVLVRYDLELELDAMAELCAQPAEARGRLEELWSAEGLHTGRLSVRDLFQRLVSACGMKASYEAFIDACTVGCGPPVAGMEAIVGALYENHRLALLSNTNGAHWGRILARNGELMDKLAPHFLSFELGLAKPSPALYVHVARSLDLDPEQCLFVDDSLENVEGARRVGMHAIHFGDSRQLAEELEAYGVSIVSEG